MKMEEMEIEDSSTIRLISIIVHNHYFMLTYQLPINLLMASMKMEMVQISERDIIFLRLYLDLRK